MKRNFSMLQSVIILAVLSLLAGAIVVIGKNRPQEVTPGRLYKEMMRDKGGTSGSEPIDSFLHMK